MWISICIYGCQWISFFLAISRSFTHETLYHTINIVHQPSPPSPRPVSSSSLEKRRAWKCEEPIWQYIYVYGLHCYFHPSSIYFTLAHGNVPSQWRVLFHKNCSFCCNELNKNTHIFPWMYEMLPVTLLWLDEINDWKVHR